MFEAMRPSRNTVRLSDAAPVSNAMCRQRSSAEGFMVEPLSLAAANRRSGVRLAAGRGTGVRCACERRSPRVM